MRLTIRSRLLLWLLATTVPIFGAGIIIVNSVSDRLVDNVAVQLENLAVVESEYIRSALAETELGGLALGKTPLLVRSLELRSADNGADRRLSLAAMATGILADAERVGLAVEGLRITNRDGVVLGQTRSYGWERGWEAAAMQAMDGRRPVFGHAYETASGAQRLGLAVPVVTNDGSVVGALLVENSLLPLITTLPTYEGFGDTLEATLVQELDNGEVEVISIRRFERDSAFSSVHAADEIIPSVVSLSALEPTQLEGPDYRGVQTIAIASRLESIDWGLTVKIDRDEALALSNQISRTIQVASLATILVLLAGWLLSVRPLGRRLRLTADASDRVAQGDYESLIGDTRRDEIGELARSIDRLATDLKDDIAAREGVEQKLRYQAHHDDLTGLINRQRAGDLVREFGDDELVSLLFIDLDRFKEINDTHGHAVGDEVLRVIARRLERQLPEHGVLSRWGGDEFLAILPGVDATMRNNVAVELRRTLEEEIVTSAGKHSIGMSVGGATSDGEHPTSEVIAEADAEMFKMKRNQAAAHVPADVKETVEAALADDRVEPFYQAVVAVDDLGAVHLASAEALVRIRAEDGSVLSPAAFLPALGTHVLAARIDTRVMRRAIADLTSWHRRGVVPASFGLALNLGPAGMADGAFLDALEVAVAASGLDPSLIMIEIPETVETVDPETLATLRRIGVRLAIDDVGVQFSNLERMVDIDADVAKLDRRWIPSMATAEVGKAQILRGLVDQCKTLGLEIIAEGIETAEQLEMLRDLGVGVFQGFLFARPVAPADFERAWGRSDGTSFRGVSSSWGSVGQPEDAGMLA